MLLDLITLRLFLMVLLFFLVEVNDDKTVKSCFERTSWLSSNLERPHVDPEGVSKGVERAPVKISSNCRPLVDLSLMEPEVDDGTEGGISHLIMSLVVVGRSPLLFTTVSAEVDEGHAAGGPSLTDFVDVVACWTSPMFVLMVAVGVGAILPRAMGICGVWLGDSLVL